MNKRKAAGLSLAVVGIIFVIYNLFVFLLIKPQTSAFWISYVFMLIAFGSQLFSLSQAGKSLDVETVFFGIPLVSFSVFYFFAELFASTVFMLFQNHVGVIAPVLVQILLLAVFAIFAILSIAGRDATKAVNDDYKSKRNGIKSLSVDVELLAKDISDPTLKKALSRLAENIRFSDPMTTDVVADVDNRIRQGIDDLREACEEGRTEEAAALCARVDRMLVERNRKLFVTK